MANLQELKRYKNIYMIGIGGISMSGIAEILKNWGFHVAGSDISSSSITDKLISNGISVTIDNVFTNVNENAQINLSFGYILTILSKNKNSEIGRAHV